MNPDENIYSAVPHDTHMKPLLGHAVQEAVKLAIIDSIEPFDVDGDFDDWLRRTDERRARLAYDIHQVTAEELSTIDPVALAQNVAVRLLGPGGWEVNGVYSGNASAREVLDACVHRPDQDPIGDIKHSMGLGGGEATDD